MKIKPLLVTIALGTFLITTGLVSVFIFPGATREIFEVFYHNDPGVRVFLIAFFVIFIFVGWHVKSYKENIIKILSGNARLSDASEMVFGKKKNKFNQPKVFDIHTQDQSE
jgi:hypothetical protein